MPNKGNVHSDRCCNPYEGLGHKDNNLKNLTLNLKRKFPDLPNNAKICEDFNISAEWHVDATAHGKSASDGIGALFKREAMRHSLICRPSEAILSASRLAEWGQNHFENITILFYSRKEHEKVERFLKRRFEKAPAVSGILKNHCFLINKNRELFLKRYSNASTGSTIVYEV